MKTARKPEPWASEVAPYSAPARTSASTGYRPSLGSRRRAKHRQQDERPEQAERDTDRHLDRELAHDHPERGIGVGGELDHAEHERDPGRIVDARLALESRPRTPRHLAPAEHREHHGRIGRRDRGSDDPGQHPLEAQRVVGEHGDEAGGRERAEQAEREDRRQRRLETAASRCRCRR